MGSSIQKLRLGGQAFGSGVLIRSRRYWALALADGRIFRGTIGGGRFGDRIFLRSIFFIWETLKLTFRLLPKISRRAPFVLAMFIIGIYFLDWLVPDFAGDSIWAALAEYAFALGSIFLMVTIAAPAIWRLHGAEHKAINAYEQGADYNRLDAVRACSRIHERCGGNLVVIILIINILAVPIYQLAGNDLTYFALNLLVILLALELFRALTRMPGHWLARALLFGGKKIQYYITTREPSDDQLLVGIAALKAVLIMEEEALPAAAAGQ